VSEVYIKLFKFCAYVSAVYIKLFKFCAYVSVVYMKLIKLFPVQLEIKSNNNKLLILAKITNTM